MQTTGETRTFFRITRANPPTVQDFLSNTARRRRPPRYDPETLRLWTGISVFDTEDSAREQARDFPAIGQFIAAVQVAVGGAVHYEQTSSNRHHYTLWGDAGLLLAQVLAVVEV
jgi:hypothetical protein